jgi:hypothetical protein
VTSRRVRAEVIISAGTRNSREEPIGRGALVLVDGRMEFLSTRPWFKSELDTRNSREESNITATLVVYCESQLPHFLLQGGEYAQSGQLDFNWLERSERRDQHTIYSAADQILVLYCILVVLYSGKVDCSGKRLMVCWKI